MLPALISHSPDLVKLWQEGLSLEVSGDGHLIVKNIPYVNANKEVLFGNLVSVLDMDANKQKTIKPSSHVVFFEGQIPCDPDGKPLDQIINQKNLNQVMSGRRVSCTFSSKPKSGYQDYYDKMMTYTNMLASQAKKIDEKVTEGLFKVSSPTVGESVFRYYDMNSARAGIGATTDKLKGLKIALIGLGGTGSYILDLIAKKPVDEIHLFDGDWMLQHNAFRAPGAMSIAQLEERMKKVDYYAGVYSNIHCHVIPHDLFITKNNLNLLDDFDYVFISIDNGQAKKLIFDYLEKVKIPFIHSGMGVQLVDDSLIGIVSVTTSVDGKREHANNGRINFLDVGENEYSQNIQIADLNCLNASLAVQKWLKLVGFYQDLEKEHHSTYAINVNQLLSEDH